MNQRIRELAEQARQDYLKRHWPSGISSDNVGMYPQLMERFAELIVRECAGVAEVSMPINSYPDDRLTVKNNVLKHFGVEL